VSWHVVGRSLLGWSRFAEFGHGFCVNDLMIVFEFEFCDGFWKGSAVVVEEILGNREYGSDVLKWSESEVKKERPHESNIHLSIGHRGARSILWQIQSEYEEDSYHFFVVFAYCLANKLRRLV